MDRLRFGTFLAPNIMPVYEAVTEEVGRRLGVETELFIETDYDARAKDESEVCFVCSLPYVEFERQGVSPAVPIAAPVLLGDRYGSRPIYFSDVLVHRDSPFSSFLDLRGHSWAYNEPLSHSGYGITRYHLVEIGEIGRFFSEVVEAGFHESSMRLVAAREVDASAIEMLAVAMRDDPSLARSLRIIDALGPSTIQPVAVSKRVPSKQRHEIPGVLTTMHEDPAMRERLATGMVERFVPADASSYDSGDTDAALKQVNDVLIKSPDFQTAHLNKGVYLQTASETARDSGKKARADALLAQAKAEFETAVSIDPGSSAGAKAESFLKDLRSGSQDLLSRRHLRGM